MTTITVNHYQEIPFGVFSLLYKDHDWNLSLIFVLVAKFNKNVRYFNKYSFMNTLRSHINELIIRYIEAAIYYKSFYVEKFDEELLKTGVTNIKYKNNLNSLGNSQTIKNIYCSLLQKYRDELYKKHVDTTSIFFNCIYETYYRNDNVNNYKVKLEKGYNIFDIISELTEKYNIDTSKESIVKYKSQLLESNLSVFTPRNIVDYFIYKQRETSNLMDDDTILFGDTNIDYGIEKIQDISYSILNLDSKQHPFFGKGGASSYESISQYLLKKLCKKIINNECSNTFEDIENYLDNYTYSLLYRGITDKLEKNSYLIDILKIVDNDILEINDVEPVDKINKIYNEIKNKIPLSYCLGNIGKAKNFILRDSFFKFLAKRIINSLIEITKVINDDENVNETNLKITQEYFTDKNLLLYKNLTGDDYDSDSFSNYVVSYYNVDYNSARLLTTYFYNLIDYFDNKAKKIYSNEDIFYTKKEIINYYRQSQQSAASSHEYKAMYNMCTNLKKIKTEINPTLNITDILKAYCLLNNTPSVMIFKSENDEIKIEEYFNKKVEELKNSNTKNLYKIFYMSKYYDQ